MTRDSRQIRALELIREAGGIIRTGEALKAGVHPRELYALRDAGKLEAISRGVYRLASLDTLSDPDLVTVATRIPRGVIAVISALHFHGLTTEIPHSVSLALPKGAASPRLEWPPVQVYRFTGAMYTAGIETHRREGINLKVYSPVKSVADAFRLRNRLGIDVAVDALRRGLEEKRFTPAELMAMAKRCRVASVVRPYLEALQ